MGRAVFPPCWLFGLRHPNTGAHRLLGGTRSLCQNGDLQEHSRWWIFPGAFATSVLAPTVSLSQPPPPQDTLQDKQASLAQGPIESLLCPGSQYMWKLVCSLQEWSLCFTQSCGAPALRPCWPSKPNTLRSPPPSARPSGWGAWLGAQNSHSYGRISVM